MDQRTSTWRILLHQFINTAQISQGYKHGGLMKSHDSIQVKRTNAILWTCLGLSLLASLTLFVLMFLLRKMRSGPLKDEIKSTGSALQNKANADPENRKDSGTGAQVLSRGLEYTVEECTCEDCVKSKLKVDSDHFFPLPAMEEGATILVTTKTNGYCSGLPAVVTRIEQSVSTR